MKKKAKLEMETLGKILLLTAFLIIFLIMFKGCKDSFEDVGIAGMKEYFCWGSNLLNAKALRLIPTTCSPEIIDKEVTKEGITNLARKCWWMYGEGKLDIEDIWKGAVKATAGASQDQVFSCYSFEPKEDISLVALRRYMQEHKMGDTKVEDIEDSTWSYVQKGTKEKEAICFDKEKFTDSNGKLLANKVYYINFYDEREVIFEGDRDLLMISTNSKFGEGRTGFPGWVKELFLDYCYDIEKTAVEQAEEEKEAQDAIKLFNEASSKFENCFQTQIKESCMCDNSEINLEKLPKNYLIRIEKISSHKYSLVLYDKTQKENAEEKTFNVSIGFIEVARKHKDWRGEGILCDEGLGLPRSEELPMSFSLVHNIDSRFYLNPPLLHTQDIITPCKDIQQDNSGTYKGIYVLDHMRGLDPYKIPVLKYCSGKPVSEQAKKELDKREEAKKIEEETISAREQAELLFDTVTSVFNRCASISKDENCVCDDSDIKFQQLLEGYKIAIKSKKETSPYEEYTISLLDENGNVLEREGQKMSLPIKMELGRWEKRLVMEGDCAKVPRYLGIEPEFILEHSFSDFYIYLELNKKKYCPNAIIEDYPSLYIVPEDKPEVKYILPTTKKCSEIS